MSLRVAFQMDPIESLDFSSDSTFQLMLAAHKRGYSIYEYHVESLTLDANDRLFAQCFPIMIGLERGTAFKKGTSKRLDLGVDVDVVMMRQDPPFNMGYVTATHLLERVLSTTLVMNNPVSVRNSPEKVLVLDYREFMPPTLISRSIQEVREFIYEQGEVVIKPIHGNGGKAVFKISKDAENLSALLELFNQTWPEAHMIQKFLPSVSDGDKRIVLIDGYVVGAINRKPGLGEFRSNLAMGGTAEATKLTVREKEICEAIGNDLRSKGLTFVGIDVIGGKYLTEINVTSPTGIVAIDQFNRTDIASTIWDAIEKRLRSKN